MHDGRVNHEHLMPRTITLITSTCDGTLQVTLGSLCAGGFEQALNGEPGTNCLETGFLAGASQSPNARKFPWEMTAINVLVSRVNPASNRTSRVNRARE